MSQLYRTLTGQSQKSHHSDHSTHAHSTLTRATTTDPLTGTLNHLTPAQEQRLEEFKERLQKGGWWTPDGVNGKASHDDGTLLRYLRARKFDINGAIGQFTDTEKWLREQRVEELYDHFDINTYEKARIMYPQWTGHRDKRGIPIYVYVIKGLDGKNVSKYQKESQAYKDSLPYHKSLPTPAKLLPLFALYQNLLNFVLPLVSTLERPNPEVPVTNSTNIVDISGVGLTQFWNLKGHMQDASILATAHYPETLDRIFIIGAPAFFPTVWGWIKRWFDPVTVSKIFILSKNDVKPTLSKFMDTKDFPKRYGGDLNWEWGDLPDLDAETRAAIEKDGNKGWVPGPCLWLDGQRIVVGSANGKLRTADDEIAKKKPVVYAADYSEIPVHADLKLSKTSEKTANGTTTPHHCAEEAAAAATGGATTATIITGKTNEQPPAPTVSISESQPQLTKVTEQQQKDLDPEAKNINTSLNETPVHAHESQPEPRPATSEQLSSTQPQIQSSQEEPEPTTTITTEQSAASEPHPHPSSLPQLGPAPAHTVAVTQALSEKLESESVSSIPAAANGHATAPHQGHPEVIVASDVSKGLAIEAEKLALVEADNKEKGFKVERPPMDRFVTAAEV